MTIVMKCTVPNHHVKTLAKAIHTLSRIGEELYIEFQLDQLLMRAISSSKSAYGSFVFHRDFFVELRNDASVDHKTRDPRSRFKFQMRSILPLFKTANTGDKQLDTCDIEADIKEARIHFCFVRKSGVVHRHSICMMDTDLIETAYTKKNTKSHVVASAKLLTDTIEHFPNTVDEITFTFKKGQFIINNYTEDAPDPKQASQMQLIMDIDEFEHYQIERETSLTCTLRELKGIVSFTSTFTYNSDVHGVTGLPVKMYFTGPGVPLLLQIESPYQYEASFVIATLQGTPKNTPDGSQLAVPAFDGAAYQPSRPAKSGPERPESAVSNGVVLKSVPIRPASQQPQQIQENGKNVPSQGVFVPSRKGEVPAVPLPAVSAVSVPPVAHVPGTAAPQPLRSTQRSAANAAARILFGLDERSQRKSSQPVADVILTGDTDEEDSDASF